VFTPTWFGRQRLDAWSWAAFETRGGGFVGSRPAVPCLVNWQPHCAPRIWFRWPGTIHYRSRPFVELCRMVQGCVLSLGSCGHGALCMGCVPQHTHPLGFPSHDQHTVRQLLGKFTGVAMHHYNILLQWVPGMFRLCGYLVNITTRVL
jgi:hypothetical protein